MGVEPAFPEETDLKTAAYANSAELPRHSPGHQHRTAEGLFQYLSFPIPCPVQNILLLKSKIVGQREADRMVAWGIYLFPPLNFMIG